MRAVHQAILRSFAATGHAPEPASLDAAAAPFSASAALAELAAGDFLYLDQAGRISAAYPFSAAATAHRVRITDGGDAYAMCAIDALGIAAMLSTAASSARPAPWKLASRSSASCCGEFGPGVSAGNGLHGSGDARGGTAGVARCRPLVSGAHAARRGATTTVLSVLPAINGTGPGCSQRRMAGRCAAAG